MYHCSNKTRALVSQHSLSRTSRNSGTGITAESITSRNNNLMLLNFIFCQLFSHTYHTVNILVVDPDVTYTPFIFIQTSYDDTVALSATSFDVFEWDTSTRTVSVWLCHQDCVCVSVSPGLCLCECVTRITTSLILDVTTTSQWNESTTFWW